jgi:glycolate oxidase iron-sulfur subunit
MPTRLESVSSDDIATCVGCGLCLPHCPTFRATGEEALSPRGRVAIMKEVNDGALILDRDSVGFLDTCIQCRACEPACPSGVPYGRMIESAKSDLARSNVVTPRWIRVGLGLLGHPALLRATRPLLALGQRLHLVPRRFGLAPLPWRNEPRLRGVDGDPDVWIFTGCVMDVWQRETHRAVADLAGRVGLSYGVPDAHGSCCGALHTHAGLHDSSVRRAELTMSSMPGDAPIIVDSAGCGAAMKEYGSILGTDEARLFSARVVDAVEWLAELMDRSDLATALAPVSSYRPTVVIQDPCHHRHVQKVHGSTRRVLRDRADVLELADDGLCCGAGGAYSLVHPDLAEVVRARKVEAIRSTTADRGEVVVASANPGCSMFLAAAGLRVRHPVDIVRDSLVDGPTRTGAEHG